MTLPTESVWDYPRPPQVEPVARRVRVLLGGETIAASNRAVRVMETASPPGVYIPAGDVVPGVLSEAGGPNTICEWKGTASYLDGDAGGAHAERCAWFYPEPNPEYARLAGYISFFPGRVDACYLDQELVRPQPGSFYGGWITAELEGPFKGAPGTEGW